MFYKKLEETMTDIEVINFFERAIGRKYTDEEMCINDIRRICALFWNEELKRRLELLKYKGE
jgi:hypothetical protein